MDRLVWLGVLLAAVLGASSAALAEVRLGTNVSPSPPNPGTTLSGSIAHVGCIFKRLDLPYQIQNMPWRRARQEVYAGELEGFFTAMMLERATDIRLSSPLVLENWYWFWRAGQVSPADAQFSGRVGAILGSHQADWFDQAGYPVAQEANTLEQLLKLVLSGRIDAFIADQSQFEAAREALGTAEGSFDRIFFRYVPLSVYFGHKFLQSNPGFMAEFNRHVYSCAPEGFALSDEEQRVIAELVEPRLQRWVQLPRVQTALVEHNRLMESLSRNDIQERKDQWQKAFAQRRYDDIEHWLDVDLSREMSGWVAVSDGVLIQTVLMDAHGFTVAAGAMPADYWLGNTAVYEQAVASQPGQLTFDAVRFYRSTERFNAHVSVQVVQPDTEEILGVLSVGVNVEEALFTEWPHR